MKILIVGATGTVGRELCKYLKNIATLLTPSHDELDITLYRTILSYFSQHKGIDLLINCAAFTDITKARLNHGAAYQINADGPALLLEACKSLNISMMHFSTYVVFNGQNKGPYTEEMVGSPLHAYGASKIKADTLLLGAKYKVTIFRLAPVYDLDESGLFVSIVKAMLNDEYTLIDQYQVVAPTYVGDIAKAITRIISEHPKLDWNPGLYNLTAQGETTYYFFARQILECLGLPDDSLGKADTTIAETDNSPKNCLLYSAKFEAEFGFKLPPWDRTLNLRFDEFLDSISKP